MAQRKKVTDEIEQEIKFLYSQGLTQDHIAERFSISQFTVSMVLRPQARKAHRKYNNHNRYRLYRSRYLTAALAHFDKGLELLEKVGYEA